MEGSTHARREGLGLAGFGCLAALLLAGALGGTAAAFLGVARIVRGSEVELESARDAHALALSLEGAVALCGVGSLGILVAVVAAILLLKELGDASARRRRGPI